MFRAILFILISSAALAVGAPRPQPFRRSLVFEPNRGQDLAPVKWLARGPGYQLFLTSEGLTMMIRESDSGSPASKANGSRQLLEPNLKYSVVKMKLIGSGKWGKITGLEPTGGISNYERAKGGKDSLNGIPNYSRVSIADVYDGVDLVFYSHEGDLEYDFVIKPGADPNKIQLAFEGTDRMRVDDKSGDLLLTTSGGSELREIRPKVYQQIENRRIEVAGGYELLGQGRAAFKVGSYDRRLPLVIDPTVSFARIFGGSDADDVSGIAVDGDGNTYVTGETRSHDFAVTDGSKWLDCNPQFSGLCFAPTDIFVAKLSPAGTILFSTFGGAGFGSAIAVDSTGVYVAGGIFAQRPPGPPNFARLSDLFVWKLSLTGGPIYSNLIAYPGADYANAVAVDSQHNAWVTGSTNETFRSINLPESSGVIVAKFGPTGENLFLQTWASTYQDVGLGIAVDPGDQPWITGSTCGDGFPTSDGVVHTAKGCSVFVMHLSSAGNIKMSTIFGGSDGGDSFGNAIVSNGTDSAYVTGYTNSANFPTTIDGYQTVRASVGSQAFVTDVDGTTALGHIVHSTLLGAEGDTHAWAIALGNGGGLYVSGDTSSSRFPGTPPLTPNPTAGFVSKFSYNLSQLQYTTLVGAAVYSVGVRNAPAATGVPEIYAAGYRYTGTAAFSNEDAFVVKMEDDVIQSQALWQNPATGELFTGVLDAQGQVTTTQKLSVQCGPSNGCSQSWKVIGTLDINRDGVGDILLYNASGGDLQAWLLDNSGAFTGIQTITRLCGTSDGCSQTWEPVGVGDFNHDGIDDLLWHNKTTGELQAWLLDGAGGVPGTLTLSKKCAVNDGCWIDWKIIAIGDFDHDGIDDLFWLNTTTGTVQISLLDGSGVVRNTQSLAKQCGPSSGCLATWKPVGIADVNRDGSGDLLWENPTTGELSAWLLNGTDRILGTQSLSLKCNVATGCPQGALPVGILRNFQATQ